MSPMAAGAQELALDQQVPAGRVLVLGVLALGTLLEPERDLALAALPRRCTICRRMR